MLRVDLPFVQFRTRQGVQIEIGISMIFLALVMVQLSGGIAGTLRDLAVFVLVIFSLHLREIARAWLIERQGLQIFTIRYSGAGGHIEHSRASIEQRELIAAMGPITSFGLWAVATLILATLPEASTAAVWLEKFAFINLFIGIVTSLPVQPLDGGRFLYLFLGRTISIMAARRVMGAIGVVISAIWLPAALLSFLIFGIVLLALPSMAEHWAMFKGEAAIES